MNTEQTSKNIFMYKTIWLKIFFVKWSLVDITESNAFWKRVLNIKWKSYFSRRNFYKCKERFTFIAKSYKYKEWNKVPEGVS